MKLDITSVFDGHMFGWICCGSCCNSEWCGSGYICCHCGMHSYNMGKNDIFSPWLNKWLRKIIHLSSILTWCGVIAAVSKWIEMLMTIVNSTEKMPNTFIITVAVPLKIATRMSTWATAPIISTPITANKGIYNKNIISAKTPSLWR